MIHHTNTEDNYCCYRAIFKIKKIKDRLLDINANYNEEYCNINYI